jgi:hypothetical protein
MKDDNDVPGNENDPEGPSSSATGSRRSRNDAPPPLPLRPEPRVGQRRRKPLRNIREALFQRPMPRSYSRNESSPPKTSLKRKRPVAKRVAAKEKASVRRTSEVKSRDRAS